MLLAIAGAGGAPAFPSLSTQGCGRAPDLGPHFLLNESNQSIRTLASIATFFQRALSSETSWRIA